MANAKKPKQPTAIDTITDRRVIPPIALLKAFEAVGRVGVVRKAASELRINHAVVSRHLRHLESWLGLQLFERDSSKLRLNAAGRHYHRIVSGSMSDIAGATRDIIAAEAGGRLLIWCVPGFASRWLVWNLGDFAKLHPQIEIELRPSDVAPDLICDEADGDIRFIRDSAQTSRPSHIDWLTVARPHVFPVATREWISRTSPLQQPGDLLKLPLLHEENDEEWRGWFAANGVNIDSRLPGSRLWHAHMTLAAATSGQGVCIANPFLIEKDVANGLLHVMTDKNNTPVAAQIGAYVFSCRKNAVERPAIRKFREWIVRRADQFLQNEAPNLFRAPEPNKQAHAAE